MRNINIDKYYKEDEEYLSREIGTLEREIKLYSSSDADAQYLLNRKKKELELLKRLAQFPRLFFYQHLLEFDLKKYITLRKAELIDKAQAKRCEKGKLNLQFRKLEKEYRDLCLNPEINAQRIAELEPIIQIMEQQLTHITAEKDSFMNKHKDYLEGIDKDILLTTLLSEFDAKDLQTFRNIPFYKNISNRDLAVYQMMQTTDGYSKLLELITAAAKLKRRGENATVTIDIPNQAKTSIENDLAEEFHVENHQIIASKEDIDRLEDIFFELELNETLSDNPIIMFHPDKLHRIINTSKLSEFNTLFRIYRKHIPKDLYAEFVNGYAELRQLEKKFITPRNASLLRSSLTELAQRIRENIVQYIVKCYKNISANLNMRFIIFPITLENIAANYDEIAAAFNLIRDDILDLKENVHNAKRTLISNEMDLRIINQRLISYLTTTSGVALDSTTDLVLSPEECIAIYEQVYLSRKVDGYMDTISRDIRDEFGSYTKEEPIPTKMVVLHETKTGN